jgi:hypothetical protein
LLDELRVDEGWLPPLSLVAAELASDEVVGHVVCTRGSVDGQVGAGAWSARRAARPAAARGRGSLVHQPMSTLACRCVHPQSVRRSSRQHRYRPCHRGSAKADDLARRDPALLAGGPEPLCIARRNRAIERLAAEGVYWCPCRCGLVTFTDRVSLAGHRQPPQRVRGRKGFTHSHAPFAVIYEWSRGGWLGSVEAGRCDAGQVVPVLVV